MFSDSQAIKQAEFPSITFRIAICHFEPVRPASVIRPEAASRLRSSEYSNPSLLKCCHVPDAVGDPLTH